jgi:acetyltransferase-like isoleucine patch superfamily enzyme
MSTTCGWKFLGQGVQIYEPNVILKPEVISIGEGSRLDSYIKIEGGNGITIGKGVHISSFVHILGGGMLIVGDYVAITSGAKIITGSNTMDGQSMSSAAPKEMQVIERGKVVIGEFAMIAADSVVLPGVTVGRYAVVGAGAVVTKDVEPFAVVMGIPARKVGDRRDRPGWNYE